MSPSFLPRLQRIAGALVLLVAGVAFGAPAGPPTLQLIPQPREVKPLAGGFEPATARFIGVSAPAADRFAARLLQEALRQSHGIDCPIVLWPQTPGHRPQLCLGPAAPRPETQLTAPLDQPEGYSLEVRPDGIRLAAETDAGLFYGVQTLIQLLEQSAREKSPLPGMAVSDWPTFGWRGRYFDASHYFGTVVATRANFEREFMLMARYKLNFLSFDIYNLAPFKSFPYCADANTLSLSDWQYLVELAHRYHVTLQPSLQSFAQIYQVIWNCDQGKPFREETAPGLICPSRPENVQFLQGLYRDLISIFKYSPVLGIGCSEVDMQWQKRYCPLCRRRLDQGETYYDLFVKHVRDCVLAVDAAAKEAGRPVRPMMWADEFYCGYHNQRWIGIENVPTNTVMGHWQYWGRYQNMPRHHPHDYQGLSGLLQRGFDTCFVSASFEFNTYLHDLSPADPADGKPEFLHDAGIYNIADQARWAETYSRTCSPGKVLGGGCATFSQHDVRGWDTTWFAYALQAEYSWGDPQRPLPAQLEAFTDRFAATFYGARDRQSAQTIAEAFRQLDAVKSDLERNNYLMRDFIGEYDVHDPSYIDNDLTASLKLVRDLAAHPKGPGKTIADIRQRCDHALAVAGVFRQRLAAAVPHVQNPTSLQYLVSAAHKIENHAQRALFLVDLAQALPESDAARPAGSQPTSRRVLEDLDRRCAELQADTRVIADQMDELAYGAAASPAWAASDATPLSTAGDTTGYHKVLASLETFRARLKTALANAPGQRPGS